MTNNTDEAMKRAQERLALYWEAKGCDHTAKSFRKGRCNHNGDVQTLAAVYREVSAAIKSGDPQKMAAFVLPEPVGSDLLLAREAVKSVYPPNCSAAIDDAKWDKTSQVLGALAAIKLTRRGEVG